jgi:hypothetical protein
LTILLNNNNTYIIIILIIYYLLLAIMVVNIICICNYNIVKIRRGKTRKRLTNKTYLYQKPPAAFDIFDDLE